MFVIAMFLVLPLDKEQYGQFCLWGIVIWKKVGRGGEGIYFTVYILQLQVAKFATGCGHLHGTVNVTTCHHGQNR